MESVHTAAVVEPKADLSTSGVEIVLRCVLQLLLVAVERLSCGVVRSSCTLLRRSLTPNHRAILKMLAEAQLKQAAAGGGDDVCSDDEGSERGDDGSDGDNGDSDGDDDGGRRKRTSRKRRRSARAAPKGNPARRTFAGMEFAELFDLCGPQLFITSEDVLRTYLVELKVGV